MRGAWSGGAALCVLGTVFAGTVAAAGKSATFKVTAVQSTPQGQVTMTSSVWITATQARADMHHPLGGDMRVLVTNGSFYQLDPRTKQGVKAKLPPAVANSKDNFDFLISRMAFNGAPILDKAKKIKTQTVAGYLCDVYTHTISKEGRTRKITLWLPQKMSPRFAVKALVDSSIKKPGVTAKETLSVTLSQIKLNAAIPGSIFAIPAGYKVVEGKVDPPKGG